MGRVFKPAEKIEEKVLAGCLRLGLRGKRLVLAVSGGGDSVALLEALTVLRATLGLSLAVATVDHALRRESKSDARFVERLCALRGLPFHLLSAPVPKGAGIEARARAARYEALEALRQQLGFDAVVTAHTATDQAETLLMRLSRGASLTGAASVLERRGAVVRPMLACTRAEVRLYLRARRLKWREDRMNRDDAFLRVRVRTSVLPALEKAAGGDVAPRLARFAQLAAEDAAYLEAAADGAAARIALGGGEVDAVGLLALERPLRRRVLARLAQQAGASVDLALVERLESAVRAGETVSLGAGFLLRSAGARVRVEAARGGAAAPRGTDALVRDAEALILDGAPVRVTEAGVQLQWTSAPSAGAQPLFVSREAGPLRVRFRLPGDRVRRPGGPSRKLQDVLVDARVPRERRSAVPIVVDPAGTIVCVVGVWPRSDAREKALTWLSSEPFASEPGGQAHDSL